MTQKIISERGARLHFIVISDENGKENFFYLFMNESDYNSMQDKIKKGEYIEPAKYGTVLFQGVGNTPTQELDGLFLQLVEDLKG